MASNALPNWDLSDLYAAYDAPAVEKDFKKAEKKTAAFVENYGKAFPRISGDRLAAAVQEYEALQDLLGRLSSYADLLYNADMSSPAHAQFYQNTKERLNAIVTRLLFFTLAINRLSEKDYKAKLKSSEALKRYEPWLRDVRAFRRYQLSDELERLLHEKAIVSEAWSRLFDETVARMRFVVDGQSLTSAEALDLLSHTDGGKRQAAAKAIGEAFEDQAEQFTLITNTLAKDKAIEDDWRGFDQPISSRNLANQVEDEVVEALLDAVRARYEDLSHRYYRWKARQFGQKKIDYWDRNAPLPGADEQAYSWDEARTLVLQAYAAFSPDLARIGRRFFDKNWIDAPVAPGKAPGAFSHPTVPSAHPYILMNFQGKTRDVMTLAHELGHGVHQVLSAGQGALMADTPLTLAETASVFGEMLTFQEILRREDDEARRTRLIAAKVEDMLNTVVRQIAFCTFEQRVHAARREGELTAEEIGAIWLDVQQESLGPAIRFHPEYRHYWMYIPHFIHSPFYVYAYAFGDCLVNSLYAEYSKASAAGPKKAKEFEAKYLDMLKAGGTLRHKQLLKPFGLNAARPDFWDQGLDMIASYISQLK